MEIVNTDDIVRSYKERILAGESRGSAFWHSLGDAIDDACGKYKRVVHAHWIDELYGMKMCSNCKNYPPEDYVGDSIESEYCPHCGARMDEGV